MTALDGPRFLVAVLEGPVSERSRILTSVLAWGRPSQDSLCGHPDETRLAAEEPAGDCLKRAKDDPCPFDVKRVPSAARAPTARGLALAREDCDTFHVFFDGKGLAWWRR